MLYALLTNIQSLLKELYLHVKFLFWSSEIRYSPFKKIPDGVLDSFHNRQHIFELHELSPLKFNAFFLNIYPFIQCLYIATA